MTSPRTLVLLRHAKSDWSTGDSDLLRPLADRGRRQAPEAGRWLAEHGPVLDLAVVSPAARAVGTWDLVAAELAAVPSARVDDRVYAASLDDLLEVLAGLPGSAVATLLVGHNPGLEELVEHLTAEPVVMATAALAVVEVPGDWSGVRRAACTLRTSGRPPS